VSLDGGATEQAASDHPRGNPENPVSTGELESKFSALVAARFGDDVAQSALAALHSIGKCTDVADLFASLGRQTSLGRLKPAPTYEPTT
jgi:2-methylcitrate dehydratase PrpD